MPLTCPLVLTVIDNIDCGCHDAEFIVFLSVQSHLLVQKP